MRKIKRLLKKIKHLNFEDRLTVLYEQFGGVLSNQELEYLAKKGA